MGEAAASKALVTIIYRVLPSLIRPRTQGTPVSSMRESLLRGCDEGPESRLAEMDSGRKRRGRVYRVSDEQRGRGCAPSRRRLAPANVMGGGAVPLFCMFQGGNDGNEVQGFCGSRRSGGGPVVGGGG